MKSIKSLSYFTLLFVSCVFLVYKNTSDKNQKDTLFTEKGINSMGFENELVNDNLSQSDSLRFDYLPTSTSKQIIVHDNYTLSYVEAYEQAEWVAYELKNQRSDNHFKGLFLLWIRK